MLRNFRRALGVLVAVGSILLLAFVWSTSREHSSEYMVPVPLDHPVSDRGAKEPHAGRRGVSVTDVTESTVRTLPKKETADTHSVEVSKSAATHKPMMLQESQHPHSSSELAMNVVSVNFMGYNPNAPEHKLLAREAEYMTALQRNLNHSLVARVHVLTNTLNVTKKRLLDFDLPNRHKLVVAQVPSADTMRNVFDYISQNLVGQDVIYINGDIYLADGFDKVDAQVMRQRRIIYGLTRRGKQEAECKVQDYCGVDIKHAIGSHDAFLFHLTEPMPEAALVDLDYPLGSWGSENVLLWVFRTRLKYCILNPCSILKVYHLHCSNVRKGGKIRVNVGGKSVSASFTDKLVC